MVVRPAKARQKAQIKVINELAVGDRVMTTAGLFGTIRDITDTDVGLEISDGVVVRYVREAIAKTVTESPTTETGGRIASESSSDTELPSVVSAVNSTKQK